MKNYLILVLFAGLIGCGASANLSFSTNPGNCAVFNLESATITESAPAPYCMQVIMTNNGGGNNFINSSSASVNSINMNLSGVNNVLYPATSAATMDPNNCLNSSLNPGSSCTFYMQINQESYPVEQAESASLILTYTVQDTLFGNGNSSGTSTLNFYEITNLYIPQTNGNVSLLNASSTPFTTVTQLFKTSTINVQSLAIDNSSFGYLYLGGSSGIYLYGDKIASPSISPSSFSGVNNLINSAGYIYATPGTSGNTGLYRWSISNYTWNSTGISLALPNTNVHTVSNLGILYFASGNAVYNCNPTSSISSVCIQEGATTPVVTGNITALSDATKSAGVYTGLYAGTTSGLYAESTAGFSPASTSTNQWSQVLSSLDNTPITDPITSATIDLNGNFYAGDSTGNIWQISDTLRASNTAYPIYKGSNSIQALRVDTNATPNVLYFITNNLLYSCSLGVNGSTTQSCVATQVANTTSMSGPVGLRIASELRTSL